MRLIDPHPFSAFLASLRTQLADPAFRAAAAMLAAMLVAGTVFYTIVEGWSPLDSLYFSVIAASTVGFGDLAPETDLGKIFTIVYVLMSVGLLVLILSRIAGGMVDRRLTRLDGESQPRRPDRRRFRSEEDATTEQLPEDDERGP